MANEITVTASVNIRNGNQTWSNSVSHYRADQAGLNGPSPGAIKVPTAGVSISFAQLTTPAMCVITNIDPTNFVEYGLWDSTHFMPIGELLPGEFVILRLARHLGKEYGTGTGTTGSGLVLRLKADTAQADARVEAFEK